MTININYTTILSFRLRKNIFLMGYYMRVAKFLKFALKNKLLSVKMLETLANKNALNIIKNIEEFEKIKKEYKEEVEG